jgi:hypothetical protein
VIEDDENHILIENMVLSAGFNCGHHIGAGIPVDTTLL